ELADLARGLDHFERRAVLDREAGGVVAAVLEALEPLDQDVEALALADVTDDSAHGTTASLPGPRAAPPAPRARPRPARVSAARRATRRSLGSQARCPRVGRVPTRRRG